MRVSRWVKTRLKEVLDKSPRSNRGLLDDPSVVYLGGRAYCRKIRKNGKNYIKKIFNRNDEARLSFQKETDFSLKFAQYPWVTKTIRTGKTLFRQPFIIKEAYPERTRLDICAQSLGLMERRAIALDVLLTVLDLHCVRIAHRDFHARHIFYTDEEVRLIDFDASQAYPSDYAPPFDECYDLTGQGLESPFSTGNVGYFQDSEYSVYGVLRIEKTKLFADLHERVRKDLLAELDDEHINGRKYRLEAASSHERSDGLKHLVQDGYSNEALIEKIEHALLSRDRPENRSINLLVRGPCPYKAVYQLLQTGRVCVDVVAPALGVNIKIRRFVALHHSEKVRFFDDDKRLAIGGVRIDYDFVISEQERLSGAAT